MRLTEYDDDEPLGRDGIGDTTDPHFSVNWRPLGLVEPSLAGALGIRLTYGTAFRAPSVDKSNPGQSFEAGVETLVNPFEDTDGNFVANCQGSNQETLNRVEANRLTGPEESDNWTIGFTGAVRAFQYSLDFQHIEIEDVIGSREAQDVLNTACQAVDGDIQAIIDDPALAEALGVRAVAGAGVIRVEEQFVNAAKLEQDVVDFSFQYDLPPYDLGQITIRLNGTWITNYELTRVDGRTVDVDDNTNAGTILSDVSDLRGNISVSWTRGRHSANAIVRYIDGFDDIVRGDTAADDTVRPSIDSHAELDLQYSYTFAPGGVFGIGKSSQFAIGAINALDEDPPDAPNEPRNFVREIHDPRGQMVYMRFSQSL